MAAAGAGLIAVVALAAALMAIAPFDAAAQDGATENSADSDVATDDRRRGGGHRAVAVEGVLGELVEEGVITQGQAETIAERLRERSAELREDAPHRRRTRQVAARLFSHARGVLLDLSGLSREEFTTAWREGASIGEILTGAGVTREEATQALVVSAEEKIDALLDEDRITDEQAGRLSDGVAEHAGAIVDRMWDRSQADRSDRRTDKVRTEA
jgi:hypothetical protein